MEKKCAYDEILRLIKRAAEKASEERGYGKDFVIDKSDLKKFLMRSSGWNMLWRGNLIHKAFCL